MPVYQPWPPDAYTPYQIIERSQDTIADFTSFCLEQDNRRFKEIPVTLVPIIKAEAVKIRKCANRIIEMFTPRRHARYPKWYKIAGQVEELAANIEMLVKDEIEPMLKINQMIVVWARLEEVEMEAKEIKRVLKQIPRPIKPSRLVGSALAVWDEVDAVVDKALKKKVR